LRVLYHHRIRGIDGQAVHVRALLQALVAEGHEVREVALVPVFGPAAEATVGRDQGAHSSEHRNRPLKWIDRLPRPILELAEALYSLIAPPMIARAATRFHPDFIYERYAFGNVGGVLAGRRLGIPLVLEVNAPLADELARTHGVFFAVLARRLEALALRRADLICVVSEALRGIVLAGGARQGRVLVVPNGVDTQTFRPLEPERRAAVRRDLGLPEQENGQTLVLGFAGFVRKWHRLDLVLACLARPEFAGARLVVVGEGPHSRALARRAAELGIADRVLLLGARPHEEMPSLLAALDVALLPGIPCYASPLKLYEYMAVGLPVVAPDQENLREVLRHRENALLFAPDSCEALTAALMELKDDPDLRRRLGANARAAVLGEGRSWRGVARRVVAEVNSLCGP
jgi:glycosyltransferase involved in cell wall biosynthesis